MVLTTAEPVAAIPVPVQEKTVPVVTKPVDNGVVKDTATENGVKNGVENGTHPEELPKLLTGHREAPKFSGALDQFEHFDVTPVIGREFVNANLVELLRAPNSDDLIRDLAITGMAIAFDVTSTCSDS